MSECIRLVPDVSVVIPLFNKRDYVAAAIDSALAQTHPCEVIVVDDGSTDGSLEVVKSYDGRIKWTTGPNRGGCAARNAGVEMSRGAWIQFLDADDILLPDKIATQIAALRDADKSSIATCPWSFMHDDGRMVPPSPRPYWKDYDDSLGMLLDMWYYGGFFATHAWLVPRALVADTGGWNTDLTADQDGEFFGRILSRSVGVVFCAETSVLYRHPPADAVSRNRSRRAAQSRILAYESVSECILAKRTDRFARKACLSRIRKTAYALRDFDDLVMVARNHEKRLGVFDFSPSLPPIARGLIGMLGLHWGLRIRDMLKT